MLARLKLIKMLQEELQKFEKDDLEGTLEELVRNLVKDSETSDLIESMINYVDKEYDKVHEFD